MGKQAIRLLIDCHVFDGKFQGTRTYLQGIYQNMVSYKDIDFYFAARDTQNLLKIFGKGDNIHFIKLKNNSSVMRLSYEFSKIIKEYKIDYAHFQYVSPLIKTCKEIITIHDLLFLDYPEYFSTHYKVKNNVLFKRSAKRADILFTVSDYSRKAIERHFGIPAENIHITPNAVLPVDDSIECPDVKEKFGIDKYLLTVSRIEPRKNHLALLKAFVDLNLVAQGYKLMMVGVPDLNYKDFSTYYERLPLNIKEAVIMKSASFPELVQLYRNASLFVFPSFAEGFGIPPLEAIEYGCPVLCSNATAMSEFNLPEKWTFDPNNELEMKEKISILLNERPDFTEVCNRIRTEYSWNSIAEDIHSIIINSCIP